MLSCAHKISWRRENLSSTSIYWFSFRSVICRIWKAWQRQVTSNITFTSKYQEFMAKSSLDKLANISTSSLLFLQIKNVHIIYIFSSDTTKQATLTFEENIFKMHRNQNTGLVNVGHFLAVSIYISFTEDVMHCASGKEWFLKMAEQD